MAKIMKWNIFFNNNHSMSVEQIFPFKCPSQMEKNNFYSSVFFSDRLKQLINADKVSGALVLYDSTHQINGTSPPNSGSCKI